MLDMKANDPTVLNVNGNGVIGFFVENMVAVRFDFVAKQLFAVLVLVFLLGVPRPRH